MNTPVIPLGDPLMRRAIAGPMINSANSNGTGA